MAMTTTAAANAIDRWHRSFFKEFVRDSSFSKYTGTSENSVIQVIEDLKKQRGDQVTVSLVGKLSGAGKTGTSTLEGSEESLDNYGHQITVDMLRNGVRRHKMEQQKTEVDYLDAGRMMLKHWLMEKDRDKTLETLQSVRRNTPTEAYADTSEANKDIWVADNSDRVLFGAAVSNYSASDHSASLGNVDSTNDKLTPAVVSLAKRLARLADPIIRPIKIKGGQEWYVMFCQPYAFRDLKENATMTQANRDARNRGADSNPLFTDGDLVWDGVILKEVPEISAITGVGASSIDVAPNFLCGAQAVGHAWAQRPQFKTEKFDYDAQVGVAAEMIRGIEKLYYNNKQHGVCTVYTSGVAD